MHISESSFTHNVLLGVATLGSRLMVPTAFAKYLLLPRYILMISSPRRWGLALFVPFLLLDMLFTINKLYMTSNESTMLTVSGPLPRLTLPY